MEFGEEETEFDKPAFLPSMRAEDDEEYEYEYEDESEEDEGTAFALRHRPVFIPKVLFSSLHAQTNRKTVLDPEEEELKELERQQKEEEKKLKRVEEVPPSALVDS